MYKGTALKLFNQKQIRVYWNDLKRKFREEGS